MTSEFAKLERLWEDRFNEAEANNEKAKAKGTYIGRKMSYQAFDGYAYYIIKEELPSGDFVVDVLDVWDGYTCTPIEELGRLLPRRLVVEHFKRRDE